jgi:hypothetical protein
VKDPRRRPSINEVVKMPIIDKRISLFLGVPKKARRREKEVNR